MLTEAQKLARTGKLTASRVACLMTGDKAKIMEVWRELCGDPQYVEPDLSEIWAVRLGSCTECLNLDWYEQTTGRTLSKRGDVIVHPDYTWAAATLDAFDVCIPGPVEAKHTSGFEKYEVVLQRYMPQLVWQMECTGTKKCAFSVIQGGRQPNVEIVEYDKSYADELMSRALRLMQHVYNLTEPVELDPVIFQKKSALKDYNMAGNNAWASAAKDFLDHKDAAKLYEDAESKLKELVPNDAASATGYGITAKRDRALRLRIRSDSDDKPKSKSKNR